MTVPKDDLSLTNDLPSNPLQETSKPAFEAPASWGTPSISSVPTPTVIPDLPVLSIPSGIRNPSNSGEGTSPLPTFSAPITNNQPVPSIPEGASTTPQKSSILKIFLSGLALILLGILIGVLAAKLVPVVPATSTSNITEELITPTEEITPEVTPEIIPEPTATPAAMLKLVWRNYSAQNYKLFYPSTWVLKYTTDKLTLTKGKNVIAFSTTDDKSGLTCDSTSIHKVSKGLVVWDLQQSNASATTFYGVCESQNPLTSIGSITLGGDNIDQNTIDEFKLILEKLEIINSKPVGSEDISSIKSQMCGGIANIPCPDGYSCKISDTFPDASGTCVLN